LNEEVTLVVERDARPKPGRRALWRTLGLDRRHVTHRLEPMTFEDLSGRTRLRGRSICSSTEARNALLSSGMEDGMREGYERLDTVLKAL
jgi:hypothetical protein